MATKCLHTPVLRHHQVLVEEGSSDPRTRTDRSRGVISTTLVLMGDEELIPETLFATLGEPDREPGGRRQALPGRSLVPPKGPRPRRPSRIFTLPATVPPRWRWRGAGGRGPHVSKMARASRVAHGYQLCGGCGASGPFGSTATCTRTVNIAWEGGGGVPLGSGGRASRLPPECRLRPHMASAASDGGQLAELSHGLLHKRALGRRRHRRGGKSTHKRWSWGWAVEDSNL